MPGSATAPLYGTLKTEILRYEIMHIDGVNPQRRKIYLRLGAFFMKSGKKYSAPTGKTTLVVPTDAVVAWANEHPRGAVGFATSKAEDYSIP